MKYISNFLKLLTLVFLCFINSECSDEYKFEIVDDFVARINGQTMYLLNVACTQANHSIGLTANGEMYDFSFIFPENLSTGTYTLSLSSTVVCAFIVNEFTFLSPDEGQFQFSKRDGILHGIFNFKINDPLEPYDVNGYFHVKINVLEE